ncbi:hypothetical protein CFR78_12965 [Komagataeibacter rhaeticus]|nr:hypothetical protein CT154_00490 [Komagataeibacter xylinus]EGG78147.1 hypothetical protein SXCC_01542 [Gluconacetobacter sp. SXCC-1]PYD52726.1 hypothetical protein CFR78_12965 [Komagataeibacter rhaeticus]SAY49747.1 hypothetical protein KRIGEM_02729 [Komagataeibacter rhaeticus]
MKKNRIFSRLAALFGQKNGEQYASIVHMSQNFRAMELNIKAFGYDLAHRLAADLPHRENLRPQQVGLESKLATQSDIESDWLAYWCQEIRCAVLYHRKIWEDAFILQALYEAGCMRPGATGLGFGCGEEPIPSLLARHGVKVTATDLDPERSSKKGWIRSGEHAGSLDKVFKPDIIDRETFDRLVEHRFVDMNAIPPDIRGYDFCWSMCALEHLGNLQKGLDFVENALACIRPGGVAVHTTEFNLDDDLPTIESGYTVLYQKKHMEALARRLAAQGHVVRPFNFDPGNGPMDNFIDIPPWQPQQPSGMVEPALPDVRHLKICKTGHRVTCIGIIITKGGTT